MYARTVKLKPRSINELTSWTVKNTMHKKYNNLIEAPHQFQCIGQSIGQSIYMSIHCILRRNASQVASYRKIERKDVVVIIKYRDQQVR